MLAAVIGASFLFDFGGDAAPAGKGGARPTPVSVVAVEQGALIERGRYPGELDADAASVASFYSGRVTDVHVRVGAVVKEGDVMVELDPVDAREQIARAEAQAAAAAAESRRAKVELDAAQVELTRAEQLFRDTVISRQELDEHRTRAEVAKVAVSTVAAGGNEARAQVQLLRKRVVESEVRAPFAGRVAERHVDPGAIVAAGAPLVRLVAQAPLRVRFEVPEHEVPGVTVGAAVKVSTRAEAGALAPATVTGVAGEVDRARRVAVMEALLEQPPAGWLPGMYAEVVVDRRRLDGALIVPAVAVLSRLQPGGAVQTGVFLAEGDQARWRPVTVVAREDDRVAIEAPAPPIAAGARVLVAGHIDLADGSPITVSTGGGPAPSAPSEKPATAPAAADGSNPAAAADSSSPAAPAAPTPAAPMPAEAVPAAPTPTGPAAPSPAAPVEAAR